MSKKEIINQISELVTSHYVFISVFSVITVILFFLFSPLILIWSINTLFKSVIYIEYSFSTYFAMLFLNFTLLGSIKRNLTLIAQKLR